MNNSLKPSKEILEIVEAINGKFNQNNMPVLYEPYIINHSLVIFGGCHAIVLSGRLMWLIVEDDGHWFTINDSCRCSSSWIPDIINILKVANDYLEKNGKTYYYSGTEIICGYEVYV